MCAIFVISLLLLYISSAGSQDGASYLQNAIRDLKTMNVYQARSPETLSYSELKMRQIQPVAVPLVQSVPASRRVHDTKEPEVHISPNAAPPLALTKGELHAIYEEALNKGNTVKLDPGNGNYLHAAVHEIDSEPSESFHQGSQGHHEDEKHDGTGYYYYYYPLQSFAGDENRIVHNDNTGHVHSESHPVTQYHSHTHQHNVHIDGIKTGIEGEKKKALQPLFMAISGFIGMAVMFVLSAVVLPKFGVLKSRGGKQQFSPELSSLTRFALLAIEGKGCSERLACEIGKTANAFNLYDNRFVKLIRRMSPMSFRRQIDKVGKYTDKKIKCNLIKCNNLKKPKPKSQPTKIKRQS